jgi:hypothetical protein
MFTFFNHPHTVVYNKQATFFAKQKWVLARGDSEVQQATSHFDRELLVLPRLGFYCTWSMSHLHQLSASNLVVPMSRANSCRDLCVSRGHTCLRMMTTS